MKTFKTKFRAVFLFLLAMMCGLSVLSACGTNLEAKYEIVFESNGGTMYYSIRAVEGDTVSLPTPEKEGYEFIGWYADAGFTGEALADPYTVLDSATLYAKWNAYTGTVYFESNGGTQYEDVSFKAQKIQLPTPEKEGYIFGGWYDNVKFEGEGLLKEFIPTENTVLYAKWEAITGSVVFESNGGTKYNRVDTAGQKVLIPVPEKEDFIFAGWYDNAKFEGKVYEGEFIPEGTVTLYARWASDFILISLEENGGRQLEDVRLFDTDKLSLPTPERWGYTFDGWYDNEELTGVPIDEYFYYPSSNVTLYAKWEKCSYLYLFYGDSKMQWQRYEYSEGDVVTLDELYTLLTPGSITVMDYRGFEHEAPFMHWAYQGRDETSHIKVTSDITIEGDFLILVAQYDESAVPPKEHLSYDKETNTYTTTGKAAHLFLEGTKQFPYSYSIDMAFRKGISGAVGPAFRMQVPRADYHYESGCDYLSPVINPSAGSMYIARVIGGSWGNFVSSIDITLLPKTWQDKYMNTKDGGMINMTMSIVDYGTWFEVYIDNDLAYTYTNADQLAKYPYPGLGIRSSSTPVTFSNWNMSFGYEVAFETGVDGLTVEPTAWLYGDIKLPYLTRENYALEGWYYDQDCTQRVDNENFATNKDVTLYAKWSTEYNVVSFNAQGGSACASVNYAGGKLYLPTTERMNYIFTGWYYDVGCTQLVDEATFTTAQDVTLYAGWRLPYSHLTQNADGSYKYTKKTEAVLGTLETGLPKEGTYHEFSQTVTMTKGAGSVGIAFRMDMNRDYTYETAGTSYISVQFCTNFLRISYVKDGSWHRLLSTSKESFDLMPQSWKDKCNSTADGAQMTATLTVRDYGSYFEVYIDGDLAYTYGQYGETFDLTQFTGNGYGIRCSSGTEVTFRDITAKEVAIVKEN